jgi:autotransporter-associated beta strand protein
MVVSLAWLRLAADVVWSGLGINSNWTTPTNWQGNTAPLNDGTEQIVFGSATNTSVVVNSSQSIRRLRFDFSGTTIRSYTLSALSGATLTLGSDGIEVRSGTAGATSVTTTSSLGLVLSAAQNWNVESGSALYVAGTVSGTGPLTLNGAGFVSLSGANTFTGGVVLESGSLGIENNSALGTGPLTVNGNATIYSNNAARTIANALNLNSNLLDLLPYGGDFRLTGAVTLGANTTIRNYGFPVYITGAIGETGGARSLAFAGASAVVLSGANTYTGGTSVSTGALVFTNANAIPATGALSSLQPGYIGISFNTGVQNGFISKFSTLGTSGAIGFDTDPAAANATIFTEPISLSPFNALARIGTLTRATFSSTAVITPALVAGYRFGGGAGTLKVESKLTGANNLTLDSPTGLALTVQLTNTTNDYVGLTSATGGALVFAPGALSSGTAAGTFVLGNGGYIGTSDSTLSLASWLGKFAATNVTGVIGFDSTSVASPRSVGGALDLSTFVSGTSIALGSASAAVLNGNITLPPLQTDYYLTGYKGGWLTVDSVLSGTRGLKIGSSTGLFPEFDLNDTTRMSTVFLNGSNSHSGGTTLYSGRLVLGHASALGSGSLTVDGTGASVYPRLESSMTSSPTFANQLVVKDDFEIGGVNAFTWSGNILNGTSTGSIRKHGAFNLTLSGNNSGFSGGFYIGEGTITFTTNTAVGTGWLDLGSGAAGASFTSAAPSVNNLSGGSASSILSLASGTTLTINQTSSAAFRGQIQGAGGIIKTGAGTLQLGSTGTYTGGTLISAGTVVASASSALGTNTVTLNGTTSQLKVDAVTIPNVIAFGSAGGRLSGNGTFSSGVVIGSNTVVSPGSSVGTLNFVTSLTLGGGGSYDFEVQNPTTVGGWDFVQVLGPLTFTATTSSPFTLNLISLTSTGANGPLSGFVPTSSYSWALASATSFTGFNPSAITLNTSLFASPLNGGSFSIATSGNTLVLNFTPVPEPSTWAMLLAGLGLIGFRQLRRRRH